MSCSVTTHLVVKAFLVANNLHGDHLPRGMVHALDNLPKRAFPKVVYHLVSVAVAEKQCTAVKTASVKDAARNNGKGQPRRHATPPCHCTLHIHDSR